MKKAGSDVSSLYTTMCILVIATVVSQRVARAQEHGQEPHAIEDNSFFIEEAYNQEQGVVQHINTAMYQTTPRKSIAYSFTQEWPLWGEDHQLSYTVPYQFVEGGMYSGLGDVLINYRYQLSGKECWATVAPRLSLSLPSGNAEQGRGSGGAGIQLSLPASKVLTETLVAHFNLGVTVTPRARGFSDAGTGVVHTLSSYSAGTSLIWLTAPHFNLMLECLATSTAGFDGRGDVARTLQTVISPGFRFAIEVGNLEVVPGFALPLFIAEGTVDTGAFLYLSFEHPF